MSCDVCDIGVIKELGEKGSRCCITFYCLESETCHLSISLSVVRTKHSGCIHHFRGRSWTTSSVVPHRWQTFRHLAYMIRGPNVWANHGISMVFLRWISDFQRQVLHMHLPEMLTEQCKLRGRRSGRPCYFLNQGCPFPPQKGKAAKENGGPF